jgi:bifunctional non-homologous end joining protein LigD
VQFISPQLATLATSPPEGNEWLHEIKLDGYRAIVTLGRGRVRIYSRSGQDWTERYGDGIAQAVSRLDAEDAIIDGELVVMDRHGVSRFSLLQRALKSGQPPILMAFDLLRLNGEDLRERPLLERKKRLKSLLEDAGAWIRYCDHAIGHGREILAEACRLGLEGIVSKRADAAYVSTRSRSWIKSKCGLREEFVIGGYRPSSVAGRMFSSILVGEYTGDRLKYRGRVGTGFDAEALRDLAKRFRALERKTSPFEWVPGDIARRARWLTPRLVAEIAYGERTADGILRQPRFRGLREDKPAREVRTAGDRAAGV